MDSPANPPPPPNELDLTEASCDSALSDGITVEKIRVMVEMFYGRTQQDELLGPIFAQRVADWDAHYAKMTRFWSSATMRAGTYSGRPIEAHRFGEFTEAHFARWLELFTATTSDVFDDEDAMVFVGLGQKMASSIAMRIGVGRLSFSMPDA